MVYPEQHPSRAESRQRILQRRNSYDLGVHEDERRLARALRVEQEIEIEKAKVFGRAPA